MKNINLNYIELIEFHATKIYDKGKHSDFAYHSKEQTMKDLRGDFSKDVVDDIYMAFVRMVREEGCNNDSNL